MILIKMYYNDVLYYPDKLNEGLIQSYNAKSSETFLKSIYPNIVSVNNYNTGLSEDIPSEFDCSDYKNSHIEFSVLLKDNYDNIEDISDKGSELYSWILFVVRICYIDYRKNNIPISVFIPYLEYIDKPKWNDGFKIYDAVWKDEY